MSRFWETKSNQIHISGVESLNAYQSILSTSKRMRMVDSSQAAYRVVAVGTTVTQQVLALLHALTWLVETLREMIEVYGTLSQTDETVFSLPSSSLDRLRALLESSREVRRVILRVCDDVVSTPFAFLLGSKFLVPFFHPGNAHVYHLQANNRP